MAKEKKLRSQQLRDRIMTETLIRASALVVDPTGQPFNPDHHQAISRAESADVPADHVAQVFQKGYLLNERLLRPALVVVSGS